MSTVVFGRVPDVPICETGTWETSTGTFTFTADDFAAAVEAIAECPAVRNPAIWLGHTMKGKPTNGLPACGWLGNLRTTNDGMTLTADYEGLPGWMVETDAAGNSVIASAYPDRSIEGEYGHECQLGHTHDFVITGIALLGVEQPAVGVLTSLQDIAAIWGVTTDESGFQVVTASTTSRAFAVTPSESHMPKPVLATVSDEDIRRAFYADAPWDEWIREVDVDPAQIIVQTDEGLVRRPYTISGDQIVFGDPVAVVTEYRDKSIAAQVAAAHTALGRRTVLAAYPTREVSRPAASTPPAPAGGPAPTTKESAMDPIKLRESLGLAADASDVEVQAALATAGVIPKASEPAPEPAPTPDPTPDPAPRSDGEDTPEVVSISKDVLHSLQVAATAGETARRHQLAEHRQQLVAAAASDGRITIAQKDGWLRKLEAEGEQGEKVLASLAKGLVPVEAKGHDDSGEEIADEAFDAELERLGLKL